MDFTVKDLDKMVEARLNKTKPVIGAGADWVERLRRAVRGQKPIVPPLPKLPRL